MRKQIIYLLIAVLSLSSCTRISFMHSISNNSKEKIFKKELLGRWKDSGPEGKEIITIDSSITYEDGVFYDIQIDENREAFEWGDSSYLVGQLFEVEGKLFMMIRSDFENRKLRTMGMYNMATMIPAYYLVRLFSIKNDVLEIGVLDGKAFMKMVKEKKLNIKHEVIEEDDEGEPQDVIVFEKSNDLRMKLIELEKFPDVYERSTFHRIKKS